MLKRFAVKNISSTGNKASMTSYHWNKVFDDVGPLYMDGFDMNYRHEMALKVLRLVTEKTNIQTIFTTHDTSLVGNGVSRLDRHMIPGENGKRSFSDPTDREIRRGHDLEKICHDGKFDK